MLERALADVQSTLGRATTRSMDRVAASVGMLNGATIEFERAQDVPGGGVRLSLSRIVPSVTVPAPVSRYRS
jgi:hypothetical protein